MGWNIVRLDTRDSLVWYRTYREATGQLERFTRAIGTPCIVMPALDLSQATPTSTPTPEWDYVPVPLGRNEDSVAPPLTYGDYRRAAEAIMPAYAGREHAIAGDERQQQSTITEETEARVTAVSGWAVNPFAVMSTPTTRSRGRTVSSRYLPYGAEADQNYRQVVHEALDEPAESESNG